MDSDGEREDDEEGEKGLFQPPLLQTSGCTACPGEKTDGAGPMVPCPRARLTSMVVKQ